jgi:hypothetical protein
MTNKRDDGNYEVASGSVPRAPSPHSDGVRRPSPRHRGARLFDSAHACHTLSRAPGRVLQAAANYKEGYSQGQSIEV